MLKSPYNLQVVDNLFDLIDRRKSKQVVSSSYGKNIVYLKLPFISVAVSSQVVKFVLKHNLTANVCLPQAENVGMFHVLRDPKISKNVGEQTA